MRLAEKKDKKRVINIICESFDTNPHINTIIKNDNKRKYRIAALANYAFEIGLRRNGVLLSDDGLAVAIVFQYNKIKMSGYEYWLQLKLVFQSFSLRRALGVNKIENYIASKRPQNMSFLYLWFLGVADEGLGKSSSRELMKYVYDMSYHFRLPICLETSLERNNKIYKRFGFYDYNTATINNNFRMWYMKRTYDCK